jgi:hypothetical protein
MPFPISLECKFSSIIRAQDKTVVSARFYILQDGGVVDGFQQYVRTFVWEWKDMRLDAGELKEVVVAKILAQMKLENSKRALGFAENRFICEL